MRFDKMRRGRELNPELVEDTNPEVVTDTPEHSGLFTVQVSAPPPDLVTSDRLKSVRFDLAQPRGYFTEQVDTLVRDLTTSLAWYEEGLYQRDQGIHSLQTDLDAAAQQEATLRAQIEVFRVQGSVKVGPDGQILRKSQVSAANDEHVQALAEAKGAAAIAEGRLSDSIEEVRSLREWADTVIPQTEQIAEGARVAQEQLVDTAQELAAERDRTVDLAGQVTALESALAAALTGQAATPDVTEPVESVEGSTPEVNALVVEDQGADLLEPDPTITPDGPDPVTVVELSVVAEANADAAAESDAVDPVADGADEVVDREWNLDDPELPVGVVFPRAKYDREYIPAGPGDPLKVARRSPLEVWAPELQPGDDSDATEAIVDEDADTLEPVTETTEPSEASDASDGSEVTGSEVTGSEVTGSEVTGSDDPWGAPLETTQAIATESTQVILHGDASPTDVSDGIARAQLRRQV